MSEPTLFNARTEAQKAAFIEAYRHCGTVKAGCEAAGSPRRAYDIWMATDEEFALQVREAFLDYKDQLHMDGRDMARKSPDLMKFYLRGLWPEVFGERTEQRLTVVRKYEEMTDDELEKLVRLEKSRTGG